MRKLLATAMTVAAAGGILMGRFLNRPRPKKPIRLVEQGDMIQWESGGAFVFENPKKVSSVHDSDMGMYVFVEGSSTGIPIEQVVLISGR